MDRRAARARGAVALAMVAAARSSLGAQTTAPAGGERADYVSWLTTAPTSPLAAIAQQPIGAGLRLGPADADVPLQGVPNQRVTQRDGTITLTSVDVVRPVARGAPVRIGRYTLVADGPPGRAVLTVFGPQHAGKLPLFYDSQAGVVFVGPLLPPETRGTVRVLGVDGIEVDAAEAGSVLVPMGGGRVRLRVRRLPTAGGEESELEIFFRDATNGGGTYPAGRFVALVPARDGQYRLDFNRARNPFCAYSSAYPCPAPWRGNVITVPVEAGERYAGNAPDASDAPPAAGATP
ncbi:MAG: DUF1684 domain-containing protein [Gemmatimonadales bacterium]